MEKKEIAPKCDEFKENMNVIISNLLNDFNSQKEFIKILNDYINQVCTGDKEAISKIQTINSLIEGSIETLGISFCDLLFNNTQIMNYYYGNIMEDDKVKEILIKIIKVFNFASTYKNPSDILKDFLKNKNIKLRQAQANKRKEINDIESLYNELSIIVNSTKEVKNEEKQSIINEKMNKINEIEKRNIYPKATIEYFKEKINSLFTVKEEQKDVLDAKQNQEQNGDIQSSDNTQIKIHPNIDYNLIYEELKQLRKIPLKNRTFFYKNENLIEGEDEFTEFKNYFYPLDEEQEKEIKRQYCGFLNSNGGRIYIGIKDQKIVTGIELTYKDQDLFRNSLVLYGSEFYPRCRLDKIKVYFIPIKNMLTKQFINNYYVVKIIILPGNPFKLYSMTYKGFNSAKRLQGQSVNLTSDEIEKEIVERALLKLNAPFQLNTNYDEFNDPKPEINMDYIDKKENENEKEKEKNIDGPMKNPKNNNNINSNNKNKNNNFECIVLVKNIDKNLKVKDINKYFNGLGCSQQKFPKKEGKSTGVGRLYFANEETANEVMKKFKQETLGGNRKIVMKLQKYKPFKRINRK